MKNIRVLIIEEFKYIADLNVLELKRGGFEVNSQHVYCEDAMRRALNESRFDIILSDNSTPHFNAIQALFIRNELSPQTPFIIVSEDVSPESIKFAMGSPATAGFFAKSTVNTFQKKPENPFGHLFFSSGSVLSMTYEGLNATEEIFPAYLRASSAAIARLAVLVLSNAVPVL